MKLNELNIKNYGCIKDTTIHFDEGITIIKGNNESGKSTTHQAILASMFGFRNTKNTKAFKLSPKVKSNKGDYPSLSGICSDNMGLFSFNRYFVDKEPRLDVKRNSVVTRYYNTPLEYIKSISRDTYEGIYSLDIDQIARLKENWEQEQTSILAGLYPEFLLSYNTILSNLDKKIKLAWKGKNPTKNQKEIDENINNLLRQLQQAKDNQNQLHQLEILEEQQKKQLDKYQKTLANLEVKIKETERTCEFYNEIQRINEISLNTIDVEKYDELPRDLDMYFDEKQKDIDKKRDKINALYEEYDKVKAKKSMFSQDHKKLCMNEGEIGKAENLSNTINNCQENVIHIENKKEHAQSDFNEIAGRMFNSNYTEKQAEEIRNIDIASCMSIYTNMIRIARDKAANNDTIIKMGKLNIGNLKTLLYILVIILGLVMIFVSGNDNIISKILGGTISIGMIAMTFFHRPKKNSIQDIKKMNEALDVEYQKNLSRLKSILHFNFLPVESQNNPDEYLLNSLRSAQIHLNDIAQCSNEIEEHKSKVSEMKNEISNIAEKILGYSNTYQQDVFEMANRLKEAQIKQKDARDAELTEKSLYSQIQELDKEIEGLNKQLSNYSKILNNLKGNSDKERIALLNKMRQDKIEIDSAAKRLKRKYHDFDTLVLKAKDNVPKLIDGLIEYNSTLQSKRDDINQSQNKLHKESGETKQKIIALRESNLHPAIIDSKLQDALEDKGQRIKMRDTLAISHAIIRKSKELFFKDNKPEFLDFASDYLMQITDGRYSKVLLSDNGDSIMVENYEGNILDFEAIEQTVSRGTKEQIFLSLRLAMLGRFDPPDDKLPVILDEALVNWDSGRFTRLMKILNDITKERQVFMFTCHDFLIRNADIAMIDYTKVEI